MRTLLAIILRIETVGHDYLYERLPKIPTPYSTYLVRGFPFGAVIVLLWRGYTLFQFIRFQLVTPSALYLYPAFGGGYGIIGILLVGMSVVFYGLSLPFLFRYNRLGWSYVFIGELLVIGSNLIHLNLINALFGGFVMLYVFFQVRPYYHTR